MAMYENTCKEFVDVLASKAPVPGGGGASALVGALGMALGNMVGSLTLGKKKYADVQEDIIALKAKADALQMELLDLIADLEGGESLAAYRGILNKILPGGRERLYDHVRNDEGRVPITAVSMEITDIFNALKAGKKS